LSWVAAVAFLIPASQPARADDIDGQKVYKRTCGQCHGTPTEGAEGPKLVPLPYEPDRVRDIVRFGSGEMKALAESSIKEDELTAVLGYLASLDKKGK
jgi:mono/diheme cytochrome c family protein